MLMEPHSPLIKMKIQFHCCIDWVTDYNLIVGCEDVVVGAQGSQDKETQRDYKESIICFISGSHQLLSSYT